MSIGGLFRREMQQPIGLLINSWKEGRSSNKSPLKTGEIQFQHQMQYIPLMDTTAALRCLPEGSQGVVM